MTQGYAQNLTRVSPSVTSEPLWVADPKSDPNSVPTINPTKGTPPPHPWTTWAIMQWTDTKSGARAPGISGPVLFDVVNPSINWNTLNITQATTTAAADAGGVQNGKASPPTATGTNASGPIMTGTFSFTKAVGASVTGTGLSAAPTDAGLHTVVADSISSGPTYGHFAKPTERATALDQNGQIGQSATVVINAMPAPNEANGLVVGNNPDTFAASRTNVATATQDGVFKGALGTAGLPITFREGGLSFVDEGSDLNEPLHSAQSVVADDVKAVLNREAVYWAGLTAAVEILIA